MNVYHTTTKEVYEKYIKNEGLKPMCVKELKNFPACETALYFFIDLEAAIAFGVQEFKEETPYPQKWVILSVDIKDVLESCSYIEKDEYDPRSAITAHPEIIYFGDGDFVNFNCELLPEQITKIYESD